jgi:hypothetical protein
MMNAKFGTTEKTGKFISNEDEFVTVFGLS